MGPPDNRLREHAVPRDNMRDYTKIEAWKMADELVVAAYGCTKTFPHQELYGLIRQVRRAAFSVAANIAEGSARETLKDYLHFLFIARGSLSETQYCIASISRNDWSTYQLRNTTRWLSS